MYTATDAQQYREELAEERDSDHLAHGVTIAESVTDSCGIDVECVSWDDVIEAYEFLITEPTYVGPVRVDVVYAVSEIELLVRLEGVAA